MRTNQNVLNSPNCPRFAWRMWILLVSMWQAQEHTHTDTSWHTFFKTDVTTAIRSAHPSSCAFLSIPSAAKAPPLLPPLTPALFFYKWQQPTASAVGRGGLSWGVKLCGLGLACWITTMNSLICQVLFLSISWHLSLVHLTKNAFLPELHMQDHQLPLVSGVSCLS